MTHMRVLPKPRKGQAKADRTRRRRAIETAETRAKRAAKARDCWTCRRCASPWKIDIEAAHLVDKGMGGDGGRFSWLPKHFVALCHECHQGARSVHSGHVRMEFDPEQMGDGRVRFVDQQPGTPATTNIA